MWCIVRPCISTTTPPVQDSPIFTKHSPHLTSPHYSQPHHSHHHDILHHHIHHHHYYHQHHHHIHHHHHHHQQKHHETENICIHHKPSPVMLTLNWLQSILHLIGRGVTAYELPEKQTHRRTDRQRDRMIHTQRNLLDIISRKIFPY